MGSPPWLKEGERCPWPEEREREGKMSVLYKLFKPVKRGKIEEEEEERKWKCVLLCCGEVRCGCRGCGVLGMTI